MSMYVERVLRTFADSPEFDQIWTIRSWLSVILRWAEFPRKFFLEHSEQKPLIQKHAHIITITTVFHWFLLDSLFMAYLLWFVRWLVGSFIHFFLFDFSAMKQFYGRFWHFLRILFVVVVVYWNWVVKSTTHHTQWIPMLKSRFM